MSKVIVHTSLVALWVGVALLTGCSQAVRAVPNPFDVDASEYEPLYDAAVAVLRDEGMVVSRRDYRMGRITSQAERSPTAFEFWLPGNSSLGQAMGSTVNAQRRVVTVAFERADQAVEDPAEHQKGMDYRLRVEVMLEQRCNPTRRLTGSSDGENIISELDAVPDEWEQRGIVDSYWRPVGRDTVMEQRLLRKIVERSILPQG